MKPTREELMDLLRRLNDWQQQTGGWDAQVWRDVEAALGIEPDEGDEDDDA